MHSGVRVRTVTEATPCRTKPARSVSPAAIGSRSHAAQTQNRIEKLVALATTLALGLGAGTANADTVSSSGMASSSASASTLTDQALDAGNSTIMVSKEAPSVAGGGAGIPTAGMEGAMAKTVTAADPTAQAGATEGKAEAKKPAGRRGRIKELEDIKDELAKKELELLSKENALLEKEQSISVLRQELEIERKLRELVTKEKEDAEEEALLSKSLCTGSTMLP